MQTAQISPLWTKLDFDRKLAGLNIHSPLYLKTKDTDYGGGDIGSLYKLIDIAAEAGFSLIQFNPINDSGNDPGPYGAVSLFSLNPANLWVDDPCLGNDFTELKKARLFQAKQERYGHFDYKNLRDFKLTILRVSYCQNSQDPEFLNYLENCSSDILNYAVFWTLAQTKGTNWLKWEDEFKFSTPAQIISKHPDIAKEAKFLQFCQFVLLKQWQAVCQYAAAKGIYFYLDKAIYPSLFNADCWANKDLFYLDKKGNPTYISGCNSPGDPFGEQVWGHAVYCFLQKPKQIIDFFVRDIKNLSQIAGAIRLDHTLALVWKYYIIDEITRKGHHEKALSHQLFQKIKQQIPNTYIIAEDVGFSSWDDIDLPLLQNNLPGVRCPQWDIDRFTDIVNYPYFCVAFASNHDTKSLSSWWHELPSKEKPFFLKQLYNSETSSKSEEQQIEDLIKLIFNSQAHMGVVTLRDVVQDTRRYNTPGTDSPDNWTIRALNFLENVDFSRIKKTISNSGRNWQKSKNQLLAFKPKNYEIQRRYGGENFNLEIAISQLPTSIVIYTNLPSQQSLDGENWQEFIFDKNNWQTKKYDDGTIVIKLNIKIPEKANKGDYELAANINFNNQQICLCQPDQNIKLQIW
jgi:4-alpha-glucanotransferase